MVITASLLGAWKFPTYCSPRYQNGTITCKFRAVGLKTNERNLNSFGTWSQPVRVRILIAHVREQINLQKSICQKSFQAQLFHKNRHENGEWKSFFQVIILVITSKCELMCMIGYVVMLDLSSFFQFVLTHHIL